SGTPGPLVFTPDGQYAVGINQQFGFGNSLVIANLSAHTATDPALGLPEVDSLQVVGVDTLFAFSTQGLYQITLSPLPVAVSQVAIQGAEQTPLVGMATSNDIPTSSHKTIQSIFLSTATTLFQFQPANNATSGSSQISPIVTPGAVAYVVPARTTSNSNPATLLQFGDNQSILPNATSEPLVVQVLDANNLPISGELVQFQVSGAGATLYTTSAVTGSNGAAFTYVTGSATPGTITVIATVRSLSATFTTTVSSTAQGGGLPMLSIVAGQGQLMFLG